MVVIEQSGPVRRIAGASEHVSLVTITQEFAFDGFVIIVENVPAYRDDETGKEYVPGPVAVVISDLVMQLPQAAEQLKASQAARHEPWLPRIRIDAPPMADVLI